MNLSKLKAALGAKQPGETQQTSEKPAAETAAPAGLTLSAEQESALTTTLADAKAEGVKEGAKATSDRFAAILADAQVKGRERAALELAMKSPEMSAADVVAFVAAHAARAAPTIEQRMNGQGADLSLGQPMQQAQAGGAGWDKAIARLPGAKRAG